MLVIRIELWPGGSEEEKEIIHEGRIARVRTYNKMARGDYRYWFSQARKTKRTLRRGKIVHFPRKRLSAWDLLYRCLKDALGERNQDTPT